IALYGWERLRAGGSPKLRPLACLFAGLALAAVMRPTFWILALAWLMVCAWGLITGPRRRFYAVCLAMLVFVWLVVAVADPRVRGFHPLAGGYEHDALSAARGATDNVVKNLPLMIHSELAYSFFGQKWIPGMTELMNLIAIAASLVLWRRNPLWTLLILLTVAVTLVMGPVPRYYVMVVPLMMLSWFVLTIEIARRVPHRWLEVVILAGILLVTITNATRCCKVIGEQRHWNNQEEGPKWGAVLAMS